MPAPPMPRAWQRPGPQASPAGQPLLFRDVHGGVHHPCLRGVGSACSSASLRRQNTCTHPQTPHRYGVCSTSRMYSLKAHTGFEHPCKSTGFLACGITGVCTGRNRLARMSAQVTTTVAGDRTQLDRCGALQRLASFSRNSLMVPMTSTAARDSSSVTDVTNGWPCPTPCLLRSVLTAHPAT